MEQTGLQAYRGVRRWAASRQAVGNRGPIGAATRKTPSGRAPRGWNGSRGGFLLSGGGGGNPVWKPSSTNLADVQNGPMANMGSALINVYQTFNNLGGNVSQLAAKHPQLQFKGNSVLVGVNSGGGDFGQFTSSLTNLGMQITASSAFYGLDEGYLPITQLPTVAESPLTMSGHPIYRPAVNYQGTANNEAETTTFSNVARQQFGVDGTGVTVGVLSDSVNQFNGGLTESTSTGNLPTSPPVNVLSDGPAGSTDEGRAMLENIHDIAPGAGLAFATADGGDFAFANNIKALATTAKANVIVDDIGYSDEPFFQDGTIAQAVNTVTSQGVSYFSSARNEANHGYLSSFRTANGTVGSLGSGVYQNFDGTGATQALQLPIRINRPQYADHLPVRPAVQHAAAGRLSQRGHLAGQLLRA